MGTFFSMAMASPRHSASPLGMMFQSRSSDQRSIPGATTDLGDPDLERLVQGLNDSINWRLLSTLDERGRSVPEGTFLVVRHAHGVDEHGKRVDQRQYLFVGEKFRAAMDKLVDLSVDDQAAAGLIGTTRFDKLKYTYRIEDADIQEKRR